MVCLHAGALVVSRIGRVFPGTVRGGVVVSTYAYVSKEKETSKFEEGYLVFINCRRQDVGHADRPS